MTEKRPQPVYHCPICRTDLTFLRECVDRGLSLRAVRCPTCSLAGEYWDRAEDLVEALAPFAIYASHLMNRDDLMTDVVSHGNQHLVVAAFQEARRVLGMD